MKSPLILCVIDGLGIKNIRTKGDAFLEAKTPFLDKMLKFYPNSRLEASGESVGLPKGQMGNSEVGHLNIGAGRIVYTGLSLINQAIKSGFFKTNKEFQKAIKYAFETKTTLHLMGLLSKGGVHAQEDHLFLILEAAYEAGLKQVSVHVFGDGRDVAPGSLLESIKRLLEVCRKYNYKVSSISGRFYSMDRDKMWNRSEAAYNALLGRSKIVFKDAIHYVYENIKRGITDEFMEPAIADDGLFIKDKEAVIFYNFRPDRARQISHLLVNSDLFDYQPKKILSNIYLISMMRYEGINCSVAFEEDRVELPLGEFIANNQLKQLRIAETQKYAHVTYFFDGGADITYHKSSRKMIDSLKVKTYDLAPRMRAEEITDFVINEGKDFDFILINFANPDMVGHTGNMLATVEAVSFVDKQLARLKEFCDKVGGVLFITADHGNAEEMIDAEDKPITKHSQNPVFFICSDKEIKLEDGILADVAPTIIDYLQLKKPKIMTGRSLLRWKVSKENLVLNSLGYDSNLFVFQDKRMFNYSIDTILLANFVTINSSSKKFLEIGTNNAALSIFLAERKENLKIDAIELLSRACEIAKINLKYNRKEEQIKIINSDFLDFSQSNVASIKKYDGIITNPPFFKQGNNVFKKTASNLSQYIARYDIYLNFNNLVEGAAKLVKNKGIFALVVPAERFSDIIFVLKKNDFEVKRVQIVFTREGEPPKFFLIESRYKAPEGLFFEKNLYLHPQDSQKHIYLDSIKELYRPKK